MINADATRGKLLSSREIFVLALLGLPLVVTATVMEEAHWVEGLPSLVTLSLVPLIMWAYIARSGVPRWAGHGLALVIVPVVAIILGGLSFSDAAGLSDLVSTLGEWFGAIGTAEGHTGEAITGIVLIAVVLWTGHASVWLAYRRSLSLLAALPGLGVLLVVLTFLPSDDYWYFFLYLLAAAPGIAYRNKGRWGMSGRKAPLIGTLAAGVVLMGVTLVPVWKAPAPEGTVIPLSTVLEDPWLDFQQSWSSLFSGVPNRRIWPSINLPQELPIEGPVPTGEEVLFTVDSPEPHRWRMQVYETYTSTGWIRDEVSVRSEPLDAALPANVEEFGLTRRPVEAKVRLYSKSRNIVTIGEPLNAGTPFEVELSSTPTFRIDLDHSQASFLPPELRAYRDVLVPFLDSNDFATLSNVHREAFWNRAPARALYYEPGQVLGALGFDVTGASEEVAGDDVSPAVGSLGRYMDVERLEERTAPPLALMGTHTLVPPWQYTVKSSISRARADDLRRASNDYPQWVTDRYLQLPPDFPERVKQLARELTALEVTAYDAAEAIRQHLRTMPYSEALVPVPVGKDWVEFFLFEHQRGFCQNYATAMITMLRSLGIPARLAVGFAPGQRNEGKALWEVRGYNYHAWPEVYFPGYGWIEFEPTPADVQPSLEELGFLPVGIAGGTVSELRCPDFFEDPAEFDPETCDEILSPNGDEGEAFSLAGDAEGDAGLGAGSGWAGPLNPTWTLLGIGLAVGLVVPVGTASYMRWSARRLGYPTFVYAGTWLLGRLSGVGARPQDTPWEYYERLRDAFPAHEQSLEEITRGFVDSRYGRDGHLPDTQTERVRTAWRRVRWPMVRRLIRRRIPG